MTSIARHPTTWLAGIALTFIWSDPHLSADQQPPPPTSPTGFSQTVRPLLEQYCFTCHGERRKGDLDLRPFTNETSLQSASDDFERVVAVLQSGEMPPEGKPQPPLDERQHAIDWLTTHLFPVDCDHPDPGRVTLRRLNRAEYNNTVRDLVGIDFRPADDFPADDSGYGFDNIGDVLSLPPVLLEKYLTAAEQILTEALVEVEGPPGTRALPDSHQRIFAPGDFEGPAEDRAQKILKHFATRAYRRPVTPTQLLRLMELFKLAQAQGDSFESSVTLALQAVLVSPHFLFRGEEQPDPDNPAAVYPVDDYALASRLSYFLWSSMPDDELFALAATGRLREELPQQVQRMLKDPRARALIDNFGGQWLQLRNLAIVHPDAKTFPSFDDALREAMRRETELFVENLLRENGRVLDLLDADYTFVNERLARHYGMKDIQGDEFRRVPLSDTHRGGVLTHASILTLTSNPTRTSPVKRGKWVLDNLLGTPPPPPPPNVPELESQGTLTGTLRERMEQHRRDPNCTPCHERMDPIGFGLEHFDGVGAWRARDGETDIDASGRLVTGETFAGVDELRAVLATQRRDDFIKCLTEKLLTYALGRGLEYYDRCAVDRIVNHAEPEEYRFSTLFQAIVDSTPFQMRRGDGDPARWVSR